MLRGFKRTISMVLVILLMCVAPAMAVPTVVLDGRQLSFEVPPVIENDRTLVPLRAIFESLGAVVIWDDPTQTVTATKAGTEIKLTLGQAIAYKNGSPVALAVPAESINDRTMVPLRFVSEALGAQVDWDEATQTITISSTATGQQIKVHFIDVGQGDSELLQLPDHNYVLIDGGEPNEGPLVVNYLKALGVTEIELMIATHPHSDHIGGLISVLDNFKVDEVLDSGYPATTNIYNDFINDIKAKNVTLETDNHQEFKYSSCTLDILTGPGKPMDDPNDASIVCRLTDGNIHFLFEADAQTQAETDLQGDISAQILKVGHHGSSTSTSPSFLSRVMPQVAVISVGAGNTYGHPTQSTLAKLQGAGVTVYRTDLNGNVVVTTDGITYTVAADKSLPVPTAPVVTPAPTQPAQTTGLYVGSINSDKYHLPTCRYAQAILPANQIWFNSEAEALAAGYVPCGVCKP
jgi:competence protein ComEC